MPRNIAPRDLGQRLSIAGNRTGLIGPNGKTGLMRDNKAVPAGLIR